MNLEPQRVLKSVHDFYQSSGLADSDQQAIELKLGTLPELEGDRQKYEQINLFVFGHLIPDFTPVIVELEARDSKLRTTYRLPSASNSAYLNLFEDLSQDARLAKLNASGGAKLRTSLDPGLIILDYPVVMARQESNPPLMLEDLRRRFEFMGDARILLQNYFNNGQRHLSLLEHALDSLDWDEAQRHNHVIRVGAQNLCAPRLDHACAQLAEALSGKASDASHDRLGDLIISFEQTLRYFEDSKEAFNGTV